MEAELAAAIEAEYRLQRSELLLGLQLWLRDVWVQTLGWVATQLSLPQLTGDAPWPVAFFIRASDGKPAIMERHSACLARTSRRPWRWSRSAEASFVKCNFHQTRPCDAAKVVVSWIW